MTVELERRLMPSMSMSVRDGGATLTGVLTGVACPYGTWADVGWYRERMAPGVFAKSISEAARDLPLLLWHERQQFPVGVATGWEETSAGLVGTWELDVDSERGQETARHAHAGRLTGLSVGFQPVRDEWELADERGTEPDKVTRREARLREVSLVPVAAYEQARVTLVRTGELRGHRPTPRLAAARRWLAEQQG